MRNRILRLLIAFTMVLVFALPAGAHTYSSNHHPCVNPGVIHGIVVDSTNWGHSSQWQTSIWPTAKYDRITNHYFRAYSQAPWYYQNYTRATCW